MVHEPRTCAGRSHPRHPRRTRSGSSSRSPGSRIILGRAFPEASRVALFLQWRAPPSSPVTVAGAAPDSRDRSRSPVFPVGRRTPSIDGARLLLESAEPRRLHGTGARTVAPIGRSRKRRQATPRAKHDQRSGMPPIAGSSGRTSASAIPDPPAEPGDSRPPPPASTALSGPLRPSRPRAPALSFASTSRTRCARGGNGRPLPLNQPAGFGAAALAPAQFAAPFNVPVLAGLAPIPRP